MRRAVTQNDKAPHEAGPGEVKMTTNDYVRQVLTDLAPFLQDEQEVKFHMNMEASPYDGEPDAYPVFTDEKTDHYIEFTVKITKEIRDYIKADG